MLFKQLFDPSYGLFEYSATEKSSIQVNPNSGLVNEDHLNYFYFIGRLIGLAVYHDRLIDCNFTTPFIKRMLQTSIVLDDIKAVDMEFYKSMQLVVTTNQVDRLGLYFTSMDDVYGQVFY